MQKIDRVMRLVIFVDVLIHYQVCRRNASQLLANRPLCLTEYLVYYQQNFNVKAFRWPSETYGIASNATHPCFSYCIELD